MVHVMLETKKAEMKDRAQRTAEQKTSEAKEEFARLAFEKLEEYFPEQAESSTQQDQLTPILVGVAIGFLLRHFIGR